MIISENNDSMSEAKISKSSATFETATFSSAILIVYTKTLPKKAAFSPTEVRINIESKEQPQEQEINYYTDSRLSHQRFIKFFASKAQKAKTPGRHLYS